MNEIVLLLGLTGITLIVVRSEILSHVRGRLLAWRPKDLGYLATCTHCMGFWIGLFGGLVYADLWSVPLYAGAVSLLAMLADQRLLWMLANGRPQR